MVYITKVQLFFLIMLFEIGSTTLFALGIKAKQDAWIVVLIASFTISGKQLKTDPLWLLLLFVMLLFFAI